MLAKSLIAIVAATTAVLVAPVIAHAQGAQTMKTTDSAIPPPTKTGHVEVRGVNYYYEVRGKGEPLLLLRPEHFVEFYHLLGGGLKDAGWGREHMSKNRLAILPDLTHYEIGAAPALGHAVLPFLNGETARGARANRQPTKSAVPQVHCSRDCDGNI